MEFRLLGVLSSGPESGQAQACVAHRMTVSKHDTSCLQNHASVASSFFQVVMITITGVQPTLQLFLKINVLHPEMGMCRVISVHACTHHGRDSLKPPGQRHNE